MSQPLISDGEARPFHWLYVTAHLVTGGGDQLLLLHARALQNTRHRLTVFSLFPAGKDMAVAQELERLGVRVVFPIYNGKFEIFSWLWVPFFLTLGRRPQHPDEIPAFLSSASRFKRFKHVVNVALVRSREAMMRFLQRRSVRPEIENADGVHVFHAHCVESLRPLIGQAKIPWIYTEISSPLYFGDQLRPLANTLARFDEIVVPSPLIAAQMREIYQRDFHFKVLAFGVDEPQLEAGTPPSQRQNYGIIGRLSQEKGHLDLLHAAQELKARQPKSRLLIGGDGPLRKELEAASAQLDLGENVEFLGRFPDLEALMGEIDVLVLPSRVEGMPLVVLEAMARAKPIVATPVGSTPELVCDGENGILVPVGDVSALARAIGRLLEDPILRAQMGARGQQKWKEKYSSTVVSAQIRAACDDWLTIKK